MLHNHSDANQQGSEVHLVVYSTWKSASMQTLRCLAMPMPHHPLGYSAHQHNIYIATLWSVQQTI